MKKSKKKLFATIGIAFVLVLSIIAVLVYNGIILLNNPRDEYYPVRGVDVSSYQGEIDWDILSQNDIDFAFIKATEGSGFVDEKFKQNWENSNKTDLRIGAYHFLSYDSSGAGQAENFIKAVPKNKNSLPPVVDVEFYGEYFKNPADIEKAKPILDEFIEKLEEHYGKKPIIYATKRSYDLYIKDNYTDYPIWIRNVIAKPKLSDNRNWTFWQYTNREKLDGYSGDEKYIDMNVFNGSYDEFLIFCEYK